MIISFLKNLTALQAALLALPLVSGIVSAAAPWLFPPLGDNAGTWKLCALVTATIATFSTRLLVHDKRAKKITFLLGLLTIASAAIYTGAFERYVVNIEIPVLGTVAVVRGETRNPRLSGDLKQLSDEELIKESGLSNSSLERIYTPESLTLNRWKLFLPYTLGLCAFQAFLGLFAWRDTVASVDSRVAGH